MPRYIFKIPVLPVLGETGKANDVIQTAINEDLCKSIGASEDSMFEIPGVKIFNAEMPLDDVDIVYVEFWAIIDVAKITLEDVLKGSDGILLTVNPTIDPDATTTKEYLNIVEREFRYLPALILMIDGDSPVTALDKEFMNHVWESRVVECTALNRSFPAAFKKILGALLRGIIDHPDVGPIIHDQSWLRASTTWDVMNRIIQKDDVTKDEMVYMGRNFHVLSLGSHHRGKQDYYVLGSIASRWYEMAGEFMLAFRITEWLGDRARTKLLKRKYLQDLIAGAEILYKTHRFKEAALKYQEAAYWNRTEFIDRTKLEELFEKAIDAWASIFEYDKISTLLSELTSPATLLSEMKEKIFRGIDYLVERDLLEKANHEINAITNVYMKHDLHDTALQLATRQAKIKLELLEKRVSSRFIGDILLLVEEIRELNNAFPDVNATIDDEILAKMCAFLLEENMFQEFEKIVPLIKDARTTKQVIARRTVRESEIEEEEREKKEKYRKGLYQRLLSYAEAEQDDALAYAKAKRKLIHDMVDQGNAERAYHFLKIAAQWLLSLHKDQISADFVYDIATFLLKNRFQLDIGELEPYISEERIQQLVNIAMEEVLSCTKDYGCTVGIDGTGGDVYFSGFVEHYTSQARSHNFYNQAKEMNQCLEQVLIHEINLLCEKPTEETIDLARKRVDKLLVNIATSDIKRDWTEELNQIYEKFAKFYVFQKNVALVEEYVNKITTLEKKREFGPDIARLHDEIAHLQEDDYKQVEEERALEEDIKDIVRLLLMDQNTLLARRQAREASLKAFQDTEKIPGVLTFNLSDEAAVMDQVRNLFKNQKKATAFFMEIDEPAETALSLAVSTLIAIRLNEMDRLPDLLFSLPNSTILTKQRLIDLPAYKLALLLYKAIAIEDGSAVAAALEAFELLPLIMGERVLIYKVLNKPVPKHVTTRIKVSEGTKNVVKDLMDALQYLIEIVIDNLETTYDVLLMKRQLGLKQVESQALAAIRDDNPRTAAMFYQDEAFLHFDEEEDDIGWTCMWLSTLAMLRSGAKPKDINIVFKNAIKANKNSKRLLDHPMSKIIDLLLMASELKHGEAVPELSIVHKNLPLLDDEKDYFQIKKMMTWIK